MKKVVMVLTVVAVMSVSGLAFACMEGKKEGMGKGMMNKPIMVSSDGGGVIILSGNKLQKYDSKLNLVKEVEVKVEEQGCEKYAKMRQGEKSHCGKCAKCKEMAEAKQGLENVPADKDAEHKAHH